MLHDRNLILPITIGQREGGPLARSQVVLIIFVGSGGTYQLYLDLLICGGGIIDHHVAVGNVGIVNGGLGILYHLSSRGHGNHRIRKGRCSSHGYGLRFDFHFL